MGPERHWDCRLPRRKFFHISLAGTTLSFIPGSLSPIRGDDGEAQLGQQTQARSLVIIQLTGGNDILNTVIPYEDPAYYRARPTLSKVAKEAKPISAELAFHPALAPLQELFDDGKLAIIQGVGYPQSSRDHQQALRDWYTALPGDTVERTGWVGRACDVLSARVPTAVHALFVGTIPLPQALVGRNYPVPRVRDVKSIDWEPLDLPEQLPALADGSATDQSLVDKKTGNLATFLKHTAREARRVAQRVQDIVEKVAPRLSSARFELERRLKLIAALIRAEAGVRFFFTDLGGPEPGGFDTHANQLDNHHALLTELAYSLASFANEAEQSGIADRVVVLTFSEFGRTLSENGRHGTDHGAATSLFLLGQAVCGGLAGAHPSLTWLDQGGLVYHTDFRAVYKSVLEDWLGIPADPVLGAVPGKAPVLFRPDYRLAFPLVG